MRFSLNHRRKVGKKQHKIKSSLSTRRQTCSRQKLGIKKLFKVPALVLAELKLAKLMKLSFATRTTQYEHLVIPTEMNNNNSV